MATRKKAIFPSSVPMVLTTLAHHSRDHASQSRALGRAGAFPIGRQTALQQTPAEFFESGSALPFFMMTMTSDLTG